MSRCECIYTDCAELPEFFDSSRRTARKPHKCCECGRGILPREKYEHAVGKWAGELLVYDTCADCLSVIVTFFCSGHNFGLVWEDVWDHVVEMDGRISSDCITALTPRARERVCEMIEDVWAEDVEDDT